MRKPDYYVFCTNLVLTPAHGTGTKDRVYQLLEQYTKRFKGKSFAIWDYDQIRTFLDAYHDIRDAYAAWITPGDVLTEVMKTIHFTRPDFDRVMSSFLQKELLVDQYVNLEQAGHSADERTPMAQVFIDLPVAPTHTMEPPNDEGEKQPQQIVSELLAAGSQCLSPKEFLHGGRRDDGPLPGRYVLIGGPGQGKTTVSQFVCQLYRAAILSGRQGSSLVYEVQQALKVIESHCKGDETQLPSCRRFPVRVVLNHFARELASSPSNRPKSLIGYITERIAYRTNTEITVEDLRLWLRSYPWLLILDGLDEVPSSSNRDEVLTAIQEFWIDATECRADILVLATTRPQGFNDEFSSRVYSHRYLTPLPSKQALRYGKRLAHARYGNDPDREARVVMRLQRATSEAATLRLMRSPLQVTIMATLVDQTGQPPHERWRLFHDYYEVIYRRETERDIPAAELLRDHKSNIDEIHHQVGLLLQIESERRGLTDAHLTKNQFADVVRLRLSEEGYSAAKLDQLVELIIEAAANRLVFLVGVEAGQIGFEIRSLQEFMAAESLMNGSDQLVRERLSSIGPISHWRNVFLFSAGRCFAVDQHRRDGVLSICVTQNETEADELIRRSLAGSQLALDVLADGATHRQPRFERSFARIALRLMDRPGFETQLMLSDVYQESMEETYIDEIQKRLDSSSGGICANAWSVLLALIDREVAWAVSLAHRGWPPRIEVQTLLFSGSDAPWERFFRSEWCWDKIVEYIPTAPLADSWRFQLRSAMCGEKAKALLAFAGGARSADRGEDVVPVLGASIILRHIAIGRYRVCDEPSGAQNWCRADWQMLLAARRFDNNPTPVGLADSLRALGRVWESRYRKEVVGCVSWPIGTCIASASTTEDLERLASSAERGELGTQEDWKRAEERWARGIALDDLVAFEEHNCSVGAYMIKRGYPLLCAELHSGGAVSDTEWLYNAVEQLTNGAMIGLFGGYLADLMSSDGMRGKYWESMTGDKLKRMSLSYDRGYFNLESLRVIAPGRWNDECMAALDTIGRNAQCWCRGDPAVASLCSTAWDGLRKNPELVGLLQVLAVCSPYVDIQRMSAHELNMERLMDPKLRAAACVLLLAQGCSGESEARELAIKLAECASESSVQLLRSAVTLVSRGKVDAKLGTVFVAELCTRLASNWPMNTVVSDGLDDLLRRRTSSLGQAPIQRNLGLNTVAECGL